MKAYYLAAAFTFDAGRAVTSQTGAAATSGMAFHAIPAGSLSEALERWLSDMAHIDLVPVLIHGFGGIERYDPDFAMFEMDPGEPFAMAEQALATNQTVVTDYFAVELPKAPPKQVYFGAVEQALCADLCEVVVRHQTLAEAARLLITTAGAVGIHGLSDAVLADDAATFGGKPVGLVTLHMAAKADGTWERGAILNG